MLARRWKRSRMNEVGGQEGGPWVKWRTKGRKDSVPVVGVVARGCSEPEELG